MPLDKKVILNAITGNFSFEWNIDISILYKSI